MGKLLTDAQVSHFEEQGFLPAVPVLSPDQARHFRGELERCERQFPDQMRKLRSKSEVLAPWIVDLAKTPRLLDAFEDILGPDLLLWSMAWRIKKNDGQTFAGWHQDFAYGGVLKPKVVIGALALSECGPEQGCLRVIPGSHIGDPLPHQDYDDPTSILARGQQISVPFDKSKAVDLSLRPGEIGLFDSAVIHGSAPNTSQDRRIMVLVEIIPAAAYRTDGLEDTAMLVRGKDEHRRFAPEPHPDADFSPAAQDAWNQIIEIRSKMIYRNSTVKPADGYRGAATAA